MYIGILDSNQKIVGNNLVLNIDAAQKRSYPGSGTTWTDLSGNNNTGTLTNGPTFDSANGGSILFDGTNDYADFGNASSFSITSAITVIAWFKVASQTSYKGIVDKGRDGYGGWSLAINETTTPAVSFKVRISGTNRIITASANYGNNIWTFVAGVYNGSTLSIYQNGLLSNSASYSGTIGTNSINVRVGAANDGLYFPGNIGNVQIYNTALSATQVLNNFNALKSRFGYPNESIVTDGLVLNLNAGNTTSYSGSGTSWFDLSGNNYTGTLTNGPTFDSSNGGSIVFDGTNDYIQTSSQIINITSTWTVSVWFKTTGSTNIGSLVVRGDLSEITQWRCELEGGTGKVKFVMRNPNDQSVTGTTSTNNTGWHMATYTNSSGLVTVYLDGVAENSATITNLGNIGFNVVIGRLGNSVGPFYFNGNISNVQIYNRTLSITEIKQNFDALKSRFGL